MKFWREIVLENNNTGTGSCSFREGTLSACAPLAVLALNLVLHGLIQYGLKEAFLYSLHHYPAQLLIAGLLFRGTGERRKRTAAALLGVYGLCLIVWNIPSYVNLTRFLGG